MDNRLQMNACTEGSIIRGRVFINGHEGSRSTIESGDI